MKNQHILPNTEVPIELRKEVYREALTMLELNKVKFDFAKKYSCWLCWLLPSILYDYDCYKDIYDKNMIDFRDTGNMFPEIKDFIIKNLSISITNQERIEFLKSVI